MHKVKFYVTEVVVIEFGKHVFRGIVVGQEDDIYEIAVPKHEDVLDTELVSTNYKDFLHIKVHDAHVKRVSIVDRLKKLGIGQAIVTVDNVNDSYTVKVCNHAKYNHIKNADICFVPMTWREKFTFGIKVVNTFNW